MITQCGAPGGREPDLRALAAPRLLLGGFGSGGGAAGGPGEVEVSLYHPKGQTLFFDFFMLKLH